MQGGVAQSRKDKPTTKDATHTLADDELPNGSPVGNSRDEQAHERRHGDIPSPVEYGPLLRKTRLGDGICVQAHAQMVLQEEADAVGERLDDKKKSKIWAS